MKLDIDQVIRSILKSLINDKENKKQGPGFKDVLSK